MSGPLTYGEGRGFRQSNVFERAAALASRRLPAGPIRAWLTRGFDVAMWIGTAGRGLRSTLPHGEVVRLTPACRRTFWNLEEYEAFRAATQPGDVVIEAAVAEGAGTLSLTAPGRTGISRPAVHGDPDAHRLAVPTVGLDEFCAERGVRPRLVKVDVEGAELSVLRGARATFAAARPGHVFVEMHPSLWPACGLTAANIQQELHHQRLRAEPLRPKDDVWRVEGICARLSRLE